MRVLIVGCGYVGLALGKELVQLGHSVWGWRRSASANAQLRAAGILPVEADVILPQSFPALGPGYDWVVHCVSASGADAAHYEQVYYNGTRHLIAWLAARPPAKLVFTSSTSVYGQTDGSWVDETSPTTPTAAPARLLLRTEDLLLRAAQENGLPAVILRVAGIYGPGRTYWLERIRSQRAGVDGTDHRFLNMIHRNDVAGAILSALALATSGRVYNAVDDLPVTRSDLLQWLSRRMPGSASRPGEEAEPSPKRGLTNKRVSNHRLKTELRYQFHFPSFKEGYQAILGALR